MKPENLLLSDATDSAIVKLGDFGLSSVVGDSLLKTACGTPGYVAPEVLKQTGYGREVDMWSVGVILYILLCGFPPFYHENANQLYRQIMRGDFEFIAPYWDPVSDSAKDLVRKLLVVDPKQRLTAEQALQHEWMVADDKEEGRLPDFVAQLKSFNAKRKFKMAVRATIAANRMANLLDALGVKREEERAAEEAGAGAS